MRKSALILMGFALFTVAAMPQEPKTSDAKAPEARTQTADVHYYHLEFVLKELGDDGRVVNSRTYDTSVSSSGKSSSVRAGTKIPIRTNDKDEIQYLDLGVNIDCDSTRETPQGLGLHISAEISSIASPTSRRNSVTHRSPKSVAIYDPHSDRQAHYSLLVRQPREQRPDAG